MKTKSTPRIQDPVTCDSRVILPPNKYIGRGSEEQYKQLWREYIAEQSDSIYKGLKPQERIAVREGILNQLYDHRDLARIAQNPEKLSRVTQSYATRRVTEITREDEKPTEKKQEVTRKRQSVLRTLVTATALTAIGIGVGAGYNKVHGMYKEGKFDTQKAEITKFITGITQ